MAPTTKRDQIEAAAVLRAVLRLVDDGDVNCPDWLRERLIGAVVALETKP